jgi:hypothetical protein
MDGQPRRRQASVDAAFRCIAERGLDRTAATSRGRRWPRIGANTALRDARPLAARPTAAARGEKGEKAVRPAIAEYESEMRAYGYAAVRSSLTTLRQGLTSNAAGLAAMRTWFL